MYQSLVIALLATSTLAHPQHGLKHRRHHPHHPSGSAPLASGTGVPFPAGNSTGPYANGTASGRPLSTGRFLPSTSTVSGVVTVTVIPFAASAASTASTSVDVNDAAAPQTSAACAGSQSTTTVTTTEMVTVTLDESSSASSTSASIESTASADKVAAGAFYGSSSASSSSSSSSAAAYTAPSSTSTSVYVAPSSTIAASSTVQATSIASTSSSASASAAATGSTSGSKRGLAYNDVSLTDMWSGKAVSWAYNWAATAGGTVGSDLEYVPLCFCSGTVDVATWTADATAAIAAGSKHLLSFNEPDQPGQCDIAASAAASGHQTYMNQFSGKAEIGTPAVTNGGGSMGLAYLQSFFDACAGNCKTDFVVLHWYSDYDSGAAIDNFKDHVTSGIAVAQKNGVSKVWITEFALNSASDSDTETFLASVLPWLDSQSAVERYAFFMCKEGILTSGNALSTVGNAYVAS